MGYEITKFNFQDDLASASFNAKFQEIETYLNNIEEELKTVKEKNIEIEKENKKLKEQLDNKADKNNGIYIEKNKIEHIELSKKIQSLIDTGYEQGQFTCGNCPDMPFQDWGACLRYSHNESDVYLATLHQSSTQNVYFRYYSIGQKKWITGWQKYTTITA